MNDHVVVSRAAIRALIQMTREQHDHHRAIWTFTRAGGRGDHIEQLRDDCGYVIQGIDWVVRQIRSDWDLIALIFEPIAGDVDGVRSVAANWRATGNALGSLGADYGALSAAVPHLDRA